MGKKRQPVYKIVAVDARAPRDGKYLEAVGQYDPMTSPHTVVIDEEKALKWLGFGAQPTDTVKSLLRQTGILYKRQMIKKNFAVEAIEANMAKWREGRKLDEPVKPVKPVAAAPAPVVEAPVAAAPAPEVVAAAPEVETPVVEVQAPSIEAVQNSESTAEVKGASSEETV
jgi:small subunit ribosomal protein S16